jgi:hypothetical protein
MCGDLEIVPFCWEVMMLEGWDAAVGRWLSAALEPSNPFFRLIGRRTDVIKLRHTVIREGRHDRSPPI